MSVSTPSTTPIVCHRSSPFSIRSSSTRAQGSVKTRAAVSKLTPCFRKLLAALVGSHSKRVFTHICYYICVVFSLLLLAVDSNGRVATPFPVEFGQLRPDACWGMKDERTGRNFVTGSRHLCHSVWHKYSLADNRFFFCTQGWKAE